MLKINNTRRLARQTIQKFNDTCKGWVYEIPAYKAKDLTKPLEDILKDIKEQKTQTTDTNQP